MPHSMLIWGLGEQHWVQAKDILIEHGDHGFIRLWKVIHSS